MIRLIEDILQVIDAYGEVNMEICGDNVLMDPLMHGQPFTRENVERSSDMAIQSTIHSSKYHAAQEIMQLIRDVVAKHQEEIEGGADV